LVKKELIDWAKDNKKKGYSKKDIEKSLTSSGYNKDTINEILKEVYKKKSKTKLIITISIVSIIIIALIGTLLYLNYQKSNQPIDNDEIIIEPTELIPETDIEYDISWTSLNGPPGGNPIELIQNPDSPYELYSLFTGSKVYRSDDKGETWHTIDELNILNARSIEIYENDLFICGNGFNYFNYQENIVEIDDIACDNIIVSNNKIFVSEHSTELSNIKIYYSDLNNNEINLKEITPSENELNDLQLPSKDTEYEHKIEIIDIEANEDRFILAIRSYVDGSGEETNGYLYSSKDQGRTWSKIDLDIDEDIIPVSIVVDPDNSQHIFTLWESNVHHELLFPLSEFIWESFDNGKTWERFTNSNEDCNSVTDIGFAGENYYFLLPFDSKILKYTDNDYEEFDMPHIDQYYEIEFNIDKIIVDKEDPNIIYGKTGEIWALGIVKSEDGMQTWEKMDSTIIKSNPTIIKTHPTDPNIIYTSGNVIQESYFTTDNGKTWNPFTPTNTGDEVTIDPFNPDHILLMDESTNMYESNDGGISFTKDKSGFTSAKILDLEVEKNGLIYVSNIGLGISKFEIGDGWTYMIGSSDYAYSIETDPDNDEILYATYSPKVFENHSSIWKYNEEYEDNFGWEEILRIENSTGITTLEFDPSNSNQIYTGIVGDKGLIYSSNDKGNTWETINGYFTFATIHELTTDPNNEKIVYAAPWGGGLFVSHDYGQRWSEIETPTISIIKVIVDPTDSDHIYIADRTKPNIYETFDSGSTWSELITLDQDKYYRISAMGLHNGDVYFSVFNKINGIISLFDLILNGPMSGTSFRYDGSLTELGGDIEKVVLDFFSTEDNLYAVGHIIGIFRLEGDDWKDISKDLPDIGFNNIIVNENNEIYVTGASDIDTNGNFRVDGDTSITEEIYKSDDNGITWYPILEQNNLFSSPTKKLLQHPTNNNIFVAATSNGIFISTDKGETWNEENNELNFKNIGSMSVTENYIYVGTLGGGVYTGEINNDNRISWKESTGPYPEIYNIQIKVDPNNPETIYATAYPGGVFKSTNRGETWNEANFAMPSFEVKDPKTQGYYSLEIDPNDSNILYLGIFGKGVYKSDNAAGTWIPMYGTMGRNAEIMQKGITKIKVDPTNSNNIYLATSDSGLYFSDDAAKSWTKFNNGLNTLDIRSLDIVSSSNDDFIDDFEEGNADNWEVDGGWSVSNEDSNYVFEGIGHEWARTGLDEWQDYSFKTKVKLLEGSLHINTRICDEGRYYVEFSEDGINLGKTINDWSEHNEVDYFNEEYNLNQWYEVKITVNDNNIKVYVDDELRIEYTDNDHHESGSVAFESLDNSNVYIDNVEVILEQDETTKVYAGTAGYGLYASDGEEWGNQGRTLGSGFWSAWDRRMYQFGSIKFDPVLQDKVYFGHFPGGFYSSEDGGKSWKDSSLGLGNDGIFSLTIDPNDHNTLWAGTYNGVSKSIDGGQTWKIKSNGMPSEQWPYTIAIDSDNTNIMYVSTKNGQNMGFCERNEFCGVVMKSIDGGETWFEIMTGLNEEREFYNLLIYPENHNVLFLSTSDGNFISTNAGNSWNEINNGLPDTYNQVRDNVADNLVISNDNKYLYLGLQNYGVWKAEINIE